MRELSHDDWQELISTFQHPIRTIRDGINDMREETRKKHASTRIHESGHALVHAVFGSREFLDYRAQALPEDIVDILNIPSGVISLFGSVCKEVGSYLSSLGEALTFQRGYVVTSHPEDSEERCNGSISENRNDIENLLGYLAGAGFQIHKEPHMLTALMNGSNDWKKSLSAMDRILKRRSDVSPSEEVIKRLKTFTIWFGEFLQNPEFCEARECIEKFFMEMPMWERLRMHTTFRCYRIAPFLDPLLSPVSAACSVSPSLINDVCEVRIRRMANDMTMRLYAHLKLKGFSQERLLGMGERLVDESVRSLKNIWSGEGQEQNAE
ncbi:MAG: hypothetical protein PHS73_02130 [Candidatus Peribacteraceae bacterium]|nr:hypothetical protein [Candidatus Peribacteraceae bacterium]